MKYYGEHTKGCQCEDCGAPDSMIDCMKFDAQTSADDKSFREITSAVKEANRLGLDGKKVVKVDAYIGRDYRAGGVSIVITLRTEKYIDELEAERKKLLSKVDEIDKLVFEMKERASRP